MKKRIVVMALVVGSLLPSTAGEGYTITCKKKACGFSADVIVGGSLEGLVIPFLVACFNLQFTTYDSQLTIWV